MMIDPKLKAELSSRGFLFRNFTPVYTEKNPVYDKFDEGKVRLF